MRWIFERGFIYAHSSLSFSPRSGFVAAFDANLSNLLFSTYLGDGGPFAAYSAVPDGSGNILVAGSTQGGNNLAVANKIALAPAPAVRLDSVQNYASHLAAPLAPGEPVIALGAGFGSGAQLVAQRVVVGAVTCALARSKIAP